MSVIDNVKEWVFGIALKKAVKRVVQLSVAFGVAKGIPALLNQFGVVVDPAKLELELTTAAYAGLEIVRNWAKTKFNVGWL